MSEIRKSKWIIFLLAVFLFNTQCAQKETQDIQETLQITTDQLSNATDYYQIHPDIEQAFSFLQSAELETLDPGFHNIDGDHLFCLIMKGEGLAKDEAKLEAHRKTIDIHYVISGVDQIGWKTAAECSQISEPYDEERDIVYYGDEPTAWISVPSGSFAIFYPEQAHAGMIGNSFIHKAVIKIALQ